MPERYIRRRARLWRTCPVMCRGDRREAVFRDDRDNQLFVETLGEACVRCGWWVHAYVLDGLWGCIRRGWCVGGEAFRAEMERLLTGGLCGKRRDSYSGDVARRHDELEAERLIGLGMDALGIVEDMLSGQAKGSVEKYALAWLVRRHTCVRNGWIKARLGMGTATNFSTMLSRFERAAQDEKGYVLRKRLGIIKI